MEEGMYDREYRSQFDSDKKKVDIHYVYLNNKRYYFKYNHKSGVTIINQKTLRPTELQQAPSDFWPTFEEWISRRNKGKNVDS